MCRYAMHGPYKSHYVCFTCRKMFRQAHPYDRNLYAAYDAKMHGDPEQRKLYVAQRVPVCPQCKQPMHDLGLDFKAPPRDNLKQWEKVRQLYAHGYHWRGCGCGPGFRVKTLAEVQPFLETEAQRKADYERAQRTNAKREKQKASTRKARRDREREATYGVALSDQYDK